MKNKKVVIINGTGGCGKDTFVKDVEKYAKVLNFDSVGKVKEIAKIVGWDGRKTDKDRKFLSDLKKLTTEYNDMEFNCMMDAFHKFLNSDEEIMFIHIREPEEIARAVLALQGNEVYTLLIKRENYEINLSNYSDASVENYDYDFTIINTNLDELELEAKKFVENIKLHVNI